MKISVSSLNSLPSNDQYNLLAFISIIVQVILIILAFLSKSLFDFAMYFALVTLPIIFIIIIMRNTFTGILITIILIPFLNMTVKRTSLTLGSVAIAPLSGMIIIMAIIYLLNRTITLDDNEPFTFFKADNLLLLFLFCTFPSLLGSFYTGTPLHRSVIVYITAIVEPIILYFILRYIINSQKRTKTLILFIVFSIGLGTLIGFILLVTSGNILRFLIERGSAKGFGFRNINLYGTAAVLAFPLTFITPEYTDRKLIRALIVLFRYLIFFAMVITLTRGLQIVLGLELLILLFFYKKGRKKLLPFFAIIIVAIILYGQQLLVLLYRFFSPNVELASTSIEARLEAWRLSFMIFRNYPLGLGGGNFDWAWLKFRPTHLYFIPMGASHNIFLSIGTEYGLLGMLFFIIILVTQIRMCWWLYKNSKILLYKNLAFIIGVSFIGYCAYGISTGGELSHITQYYPLTMLNSFTLILFVLFAVVTVMYYDERQHGVKKTW